MNKDIKQQQCQSCGRASEVNNNFCLLHKPGMTPLMFLSDYKDCKQGFLGALPLPEANELLKEGIAVEINGEMYDDYQLKMADAVGEALRNTANRYKEYIKNNSTAEIKESFKTSTKDHVLKFIESEYFTDTEKGYLTKIAEEVFE